MRIVKKKIPLPLDFSCPVYPSFSAPLKQHRFSLAGIQRADVRGVDVSLAEELLCTPSRASPLSACATEAEKGGMGGQIFSNVWNEEIPQAITFGISALKRLITSEKTPVPQSRGTLNPQTDHLSSARHEYDNP